MIIRNDEHKIETSENVFGGTGSVHFKRIIETPRSFTTRAEYSRS